VSAYLIEIDDTKRGVMSPTVVGPFKDEGAARAFAEEMQMGEAAQSGQGGYSAYHVISDATCDYSPERYREEHEEELAEYGEDEL